MVKTARALAREQGRPVSQQIAQRLTENHDAAAVEGISVTWPPETWGSWLSAWVPFRSDLPEIPSTAQ
ncbi:hypothetical protein AB0F43_30295 [Kribbella sp. NPDC023972]|uniref:hypothetical protein n=1 Tax=Kribbella sp. NPDC023972 TaxID=3154795 RepID=UPI0033CC4E28